uniref:Calponin n=1 Tax=Cerebratulus lacteus TaxID=6221 RepID=E2ICJ9_CERLA|nr:calponin [Cerebratulus lacteus]
MAAPMGDQRAVTSKVASKYDTGNEAQVISWVKALCGTDLKAGMKEMKEQLSDGHVLVSLVNAVIKGTPPDNLPASAKKLKACKLNKSKMAFAHMENIQNFVSACEAYGVPKTCTFQTVDLYEGRNMPQVLNCIMALGTEAQRCNFNGMTIGAAPTTKNVREFTEEQLAAGKKIIGGQAGFTGGASQSGMSMGAGRHIADIKVDAMSKEGQSVIGGQAGFTGGASQAGMSAGGIRHISDIKVESMSKEGQSVIGGQAGFTGGASQSGMSAGGIRHVADIKVDSMSKEGQSVIGGQAGFTGGASQAGMSAGGARHIADIKVDAMSKEGQSVIGGQAGFTGGASQSGMSAGGARHIADIKVDEMNAASKSMY